MKLYRYGKPIVPGEPLVLVGRMEGEDGTIGDCRVNWPPGKTLWGVSYEEALRQAQACGCVTITCGEDAPAPPAAG